MIDESRMFVSRSNHSNTSSQMTPTNSSSTLPQDGGNRDSLSSAPSLAPATADSASGEDLAMPTQDEVVKKTERITKKIQELLIAAQEGKHDRQRY